MAKLLARDEMKRLALVGAAARLTELEREKAAILRVFPGLRSQSGGRAGSSAGGRKRRQLTKAQRKAISARMKKFWATRRKT